MSWGVGRWGFRLWGLRRRLCRLWRMVTGGAEGGGGVCDCIKCERLIGVWRSLAGGWAVPTCLLLLLGLYLLLRRRESREQTGDEEKVLGGGGRERRERNT